MKPDNLRRTEVLRVRATVREADAAWQNAQRHGLSLAQALRTSLRLEIARLASDRG
jgi:hypothetical protein